MNQFIGGLLTGIGVGLLLCGFVASSLVTDFTGTLDRYETQIDTFYALTHSHGFQAIQDVTSQTAAFYQGNPVLRQIVETMGMPQLGQLLSDVEENLGEVVTMSEDLYAIKSTVRSIQSLIPYLTIGSIVLLVSGIATAWVSRSTR